MIHHDAWRMIHDAWQRVHDPGSSLRFSLACSLVPAHPRLPAMRATTTPSAEGHTTKYGTPETCALRSPAVIAPALLALLGCWLSSHVHHISYCAGSAARLRHRAIHPEAMAMELVVMTERFETAAAPRR